MKAKMEEKGRFIVFGMVVDVRRGVELLVLTGKDSERVERKGFSLI